LPEAQPDNTSATADRMASSTCSRFVVCSITPLLPLRAPVQPFSAPSFVLFVTFCKNASVMPAPASTRAGGRPRRGGWWWRWRR
jgi:hypothetical protein